MTPNDARQHLSAYLDGELDEPTRRAVDAALAADAELRAELDALRHTAELVGSLPRVPAPEDFAARVAAAIQADASQATPPSPLRRWRHLISAAAACLLIGIIAVVAVQNRRPRDKALTPAKREPAPATSALRADKYAEHDADRAAPEALRAKRGADDPMAPSPATTKMEGTYGKDDKGERMAKAKTSMTRDSAARREVESKGLALGQDAKVPGGPLGKGDAGAGVRAKVMARRTQHAEGAFAADEAQQVDRELFAAITQRKARASVAAQSGGRGGGGEKRAPEPTMPKPAAPAATPPPRPGPAPLAEAEEHDDFATGYDGPGAPVLRHELRYVDLQEKLAQVQLALRDAHVPFVIQPLGAGHFVVAADLERGEALVLLDRLGGRKEKAPAPTRAPAKPATDHRARSVANGVGRQPTVRLVLRFRPALIAPAAEPKR